MNATAREVFHIATVNAKNLMKRILKSQHLQLHGSDFCFVVYSTRKLRDNTLNSVIDSFSHLYFCGTLTAANKQTTTKKREKRLKQIKYNITNPLVLDPNLKICHQACARVDTISI